MDLRSAIRCPCERACKERRETAVNLLIKRNVCTTGELREILREGGLGISATRKSLEFLCSGQCKWGKVFASATDRKQLRFGKRGRVLYKKTVAEDTLKRKILSLLTRLQTQILLKFSKQHKSIYYFSIYDLRKLLPYSGNAVKYAVSRLTRIGLIEEVIIDKVSFYTKPTYVSRLESQKQSAIVDDKAEFALVKRVHELIMNLYPMNLILEFKGAIRPHTKEVLEITGGMTFDIFYEFREPVVGRSFLAIDIYTRIPVNGYVVNSFIKKIEWAKISHRGKPNYHLKDKTYGMIVFKNATRRAIELANKNKIRFIRLSDIKVNYDILRKETDSQDYAH